jgi:hypothetical protein
MFCSSCGFKQIDRASNFCSGCGLLLSENANREFSSLHLPQHPRSESFESIRKIGMKRGGKMILAGLILVPLVGILSEIFFVNPFFVGLTALICFWGGFLRIVYAAIFEGNESETLEKKLKVVYAKYLTRKHTTRALPPESINFSNVSYGKQGTWRDSSDSSNSSDRN